MFSFFIIKIPFFFIYFAAARLLYNLNQTTSVRVEKIFEKFNSN